MISAAVAKHSDQKKLMVGKNLIHLTIHSASSRELRAGARAAQGKNTRQAGQEHKGAQGSSGQEHRAVIQGRNSGEEYRAGTQGRNTRELRESQGRNIGQELKTGAQGRHR